jgi:hypothetical protein
MLHADDECRIQPAVLRTGARKAASLSRPAMSAAEADSIFVGGEMGLSRLSRQSTVSRDWARSPMTSWPSAAIA